MHDRILLSSYCFESVPAGNHENFCSQISVFDSDRICARYNRTEIRPQGLIDLEGLK